MSVFFQLLHGKIIPHTLHLSTSVSSVYRSFLKALFKNIHNGKHSSIHFTYLMNSTLDMHTIGKHNDPIP